MYNLLKYSENYSMTSGSFWNYYRDVINSDTNTNNTARNKIYNNKMITYKSFEYETKLLGSMPNNNNILGTEVAVPLKYLSNFWRSNLRLTKKLCNIISRTFSAVPNTNPVAQEVVPATTSATFEINNANFFVPVGTFSMNDNIKFLRNIEHGFKRTIS